MAGTRTLSWVELKLFLREPITVVFTLALPPLVLYVLAQVFGNAPDPAGRVYGGAGPVDYYTPAYIGLVIVSLGVIGLPVHLASYRERGVLRRFQAARMPAYAILVAQLAVLFAAVLAGSALLLILARLSFHVHWPASWWGVGLAVVLGTLTFAAIGVLLGAVLPTARAAQGIGVLLWFLMMMISGAGPPPEVLGPVLRRIGDFTPLKPLRVAIQDPWLGHGVNWTQMLVLFALLVVCAALSAMALRRRD
ncbi:ABC transporter permease [Amycolatopsis mongoliensis]|uniref:ABC transporter permease n=1 Tax=Amycolatopsis mongoliensis TaxID=715475 RepID=A0A9Y2NBI2_9PSEU|nr:ABC transporter permease [Amycolatopsis sp. 4-36]WIX98516.1 ABC transporter permease [Amycolatopsis sp. 4-36]